MTNQIMLIGRLVSDPQINETENRNKESIITLAVTRSYKNLEGIYETDFIPVRLFKGIAEQTSEYCRKGDLIAIRGRVQKLTNEDLAIVGEKVSFLTSKPKEEE